ncbi:NAD(P)H-quinone oxidoreductase subunit 2, chloroplastic [Streptomyces alboniger]
MTSVGDVPFLIGLFALATDAGSFRITKVLGAVAHGGLDHPTLIALLLLAGVAGKSAQFPLHTWLPDAMAGPTPVSALIHAATMVAAGVVFVARLLPVFEASRAAMAVLAVMAAVTMVGSALAALAQDDIKRVLAYSTIGQLGYMTGALAVGDRGAAVFHLLAHGAFKALLFLAAGVIIHAAGTNSLAAMSRMSNLRHRIPDAFWTMTVALLALAAIPPFSGFFSKESVLGAAEHVATGHTEHAPGAAGWTVLVAALLTALLTAAYATRLWLLAFHGRGTEAPDHGRQPLTMTVLWVSPSRPSPSAHSPTARCPTGSTAATSPRPSPPPSRAREWPWSAVRSPTPPGGTPPRSRPAPRSAPSPPTPRATPPRWRPRPSPATSPPTETSPTHPTPRTRHALCLTDPAVHQLHAGGTRRAPWPSRWPRPSSSPSTGSPSPRPPSRPSSGSSSSSPTCSSATTGRHCSAGSRSRASPPPPSCRCPSWTATARRSA